jgi:predicted transcriptional regulator
MKNIIVKLVKIANDMDALGMHEEADEVTKVAKEMHEDGDREAAGMINLNTDQVQKQRKVNIDQKNIDNSVKKVDTLKDF